MSKEPSAVLFLEIAEHLGLSCDVTEDMILERIRLRRRLLNGTNFQAEWERHLEANHGGLHDPFCETCRLAICAMAAIEEAR